MNKSLWQGRWYVSDRSSIQRGWVWESGGCSENDWFSSLAEAEDTLLGTIDTDATMFGEYQIRCPAEECLPNSKEGTELLRFLSRYVIRLGLHFGERNQAVTSYKLPWERLSLHLLRKLLARIFFLK